MPECPGKGAGDGSRLHGPAAGRGLQRPRAPLLAVERVDLLHGVCKSVAAEIAGDRSVWIEGCYYDQCGRPIYKPLNMADGHPRQINIQVGGKIVDIASISPVVAGAASFNLYRVYYDDAVEGHGKTLETAIHAAVRRPTIGGRRYGGLAGGSRYIGDRTTGWLRIKCTKR